MHICLQTAVFLTIVRFSLWDGGHIPGMDVFVKLSNENGEAWSDHIGWK